MSTPRRGLGRGLGSLIPTGPSKTAVLEPPTPADPESAAASPSGAEPSETSATGVPQDELAAVDGAYFAELSPTAITPNPRQPRTVFDEEAMAELVHSIREVGLLQPIVVRSIAPTTATSSSWASDAGGPPRRPGSTAIPAIVRETKDDELLRDALLENLHRAQLNPLEEAAAYQQMLDDFGCTHEELASRIGRSRPQISNTLATAEALRPGPAPGRRRRARLPATPGPCSGSRTPHARTLSPPGWWPRASRCAASKSWWPSGDGSRAGDEDDPATRVGAGAGRDRRPARDRFETRCKVTLGRAKGRITVEFASLDDLQRILSLMDPQTD